MKLHLLFVGNKFIYNNSLSGTATGDFIHFDYEQACRDDCNGDWANPEDSYPGQDQFGRGQDTGWGTTQADDEVSLWAWGNTENGSGVDPVANNDCEAHTSLIQEDRDYFWSSPDGYSAYTYPHPLRGTPTAGPSRLVMVLS